MNDLIIDFFFWYFAIGFVIGCWMCPTPEAITSWREFWKALKEFGEYAFFYTFFWLLIGVAVVTVKIGQQDLPAWYYNVWRERRMIWNRDYRYYYCDLKCFLTNQRWCNKPSKRNEQP